MPSPNLTEFNLVRPLNILFGIEPTLLGMSTVVKLLHPLNIVALIPVNPSCIITSVNDVQFSNILSPISLIKPGNVILTNPVLANA